VLRNAFAWWKIRYQWSGYTSGFFCVTFLCLLALQ
jgi:hypothetical protein